MSSSSQRTSKTKIVMVVGANSIYDDWFFGNMEYFQLYEKNPKTSYKDIKFRIQDKNEKDPRSIYTRQDFNQGNQFFKQFGTNETKKMGHEIDVHCRALHKELVKGDTFVFIWCSHGNEKGVTMSGGLVHWKDIKRQILAGFQSGVHKSVIIQACNSSVFADEIKVENPRSRFMEPIIVQTFAQATQKLRADKRSVSGRHRNSVFSAAFLKSLGLAYEPKTSSYTLQKHLDYTNKHRASIDGSILKVQPHHHTILDMPKPFLDVLFGDYAEINMTPIPNVSCSPTPRPLSQGPDHRSIEVDSPTVDAAVKFIEEEAAKLGDDVGENDIGIIDCHLSAKQAYLQGQIDPIDFFIDFFGKQLACLKYRFRVQEYFWLAYEILCEKKLLRPSGLYPTNDWGNLSKNVLTIADKLYCFQILYKCMTPCKAESAEGNFEEPVYWLAMQICRTSSDMERIFLELVYSQVIGGYNPQLKMENTNLFGPDEDEEDEQDDDEEDEEVKTVRISKYDSTLGYGVTELTPPQRFGYWLPEGIASPRLAMEYYGGFSIRYNRLKKLYKSFFGKDKWGDESHNERFESAWNHMERDLFVVGQWWKQDDDW